MRENKNCDYLLRVISEKGNVRGLAAITTDTVAEACGRHKTSSTASAALGRALTCGVLMGSLLKKRQRIALRFEGNGPLKKINVEANDRGGVRGYVAAPDAQAPLHNGKIDVPAAIGRAGLLTVTKDLGLKEPYTSTVHLVSGEIGEDLAYYYAESEQIPSAVGVGVYVEPGGAVSASGGFLIQSMPPVEEQTIGAIIERIGKLGSIAEFFRKGRKPEDLLNIIFADVPYELLERYPVSYHCHCSRERIKQGIISLGAKEIGTLIEEHEPTEAECEFCHTRYVFSRDDLRALEREARS